MQLFMLLMFVALAIFLYQWVNPEDSSFNYLVLGLFMQVFYFTLFRLLLKNSLSFFKIFFQDYFLVCSSFKKPTKIWPSVSVIKCPILMFSILWLLWKNVRLLLLSNISLALYSSPRFKCMNFGFSPKYNMHFTRFSSGFKCECTRGLTQCILFLLGWHFSFLLWNEESFESWKSLEFFLEMLINNLSSTTVRKSFHTAQSLNHVEYCKYIDK